MKLLVLLNFTDRKINDKNEWWLKVSKLLEIIKNKI